MYKHTGGTVVLCMERYKKRALSFVCLKYNGIHDVLYIHIHIKYYLRVHTGDMIMWGKLSGLDYRYVSVFLDTSVNRQSLTHAINILLYTNQNNFNCLFYILIFTNRNIINIRMNTIDSMICILQYNLPLLAISLSVSNML